MGTKKKIKLKSISLILIFTLVFQYISCIVPLLKSVALTIVDSNDIEWEYYISGEEAINVRLKDKTVSGDIEVPTTLDGYKVKTIGSEAFFDAYNITSITIPEYVEGIGSNCFKDCDNLTVINIRSNVINNLVGKFNGLEKLKTINISENNTNYTVDEYGVLYNKDKTELIKCPEGSDLANYTIPSTVTLIYTRAFQNCQGLVTIKLPTSISYIAEYTFFNCRNLESIRVPGNVEKIWNSAFERCQGLRSITIEEGVKEILANAFKKEDMLSFYDSNVYLPDSLTSIGNNNFNVGATIWVNKGTKGETYAKNARITYYYNDREVYTDANGITWEYYIKNGETAEKAVIKNEIENANYEFTIPSTLGTSNYRVKSIGSGGVTSDGASTIFYSGKRNIKSVVISDGLERIGSNSFSGCTNMETITIPSSVTSIGENAFKDCDNLTIICDSNSEAYRYAIANNINVLATTDLQFNDQNLYNKVKQILNDNNYNIIIDDEINKFLRVTAEDIEKITSLDVSNLEITDLTGINAFNALQELNASGNELQSIYDSMLKINTLEKLDLSNNNIRGIYSNLFNLKELNLSNNNIESIEQFNFSNLLNLENLDLSNNNIANYVDKYFNDIDHVLEPLKSLTKLETINLDNNSISNTSILNEMQESNLENVSLKNQKIDVYTISKENKTNEILPIILEAKSQRYNNGENVTLETVNCEIIDDTIIVANTINDSDNPAKITIHGGKMDGTVCTINAQYDVNINYTIDGNTLLLNFDSFLYRDEKPYLLYSIDGSEYVEYNDYIILNEGIHTVSIKLFDREILNFETDNIKVNINAIRKNGKVYIYSNSYADTFYSFEENGTYEKYTNPIENENSKKVYVKIGELEAREVTIQDTLINSEDEYNIYDTKAGNNVLQDFLQVYFIRENGKLYFYVPSSWGGASYSLDNENWNTASLTEKNEIADPNAEYVYMSYNEKGYTKGYYGKFSTNNVNKLEEILGIYNEGNNSFVFSQERKGSANEEGRLKIINDENKLEKFNEKIIDATQYNDKQLVLKDDGTVYEIIPENDYELKSIIGGTNIKSISGDYALNNNNNILKIDSSTNPMEYKPFNEVQLEKRTQKILSYSSKNDNELFTSNELYILYEDGKVECFKIGDSNGILIGNDDTTSETLSYHAIDINGSNDYTFILEYDNVKVYGDTIKKINFREIFEDGEIPIKISNRGSILTSKGNLYYLTYKAEERVDWQGYDYTVYIPDSYSNTNKISNVKRIGDYTYQDKDGNILYIYYKNTAVETLPVNKLITDINISKDESEIASNKVKINIDFTENKYSVKLPNGSEYSNATTYEVNENGEYVFEFTDSEGYKFIRVVHVRNIQNRKEIKVPEVIAVDKTIELKSDNTIEYSIDEKNRWNEYSGKITYNRPIYARIVSDEYECSILKITLNEEGKLEVLNEDTREIQSGILTNAIGTTIYQIYDNNTKIIKIAQNVAQTVSNTEINPNLFNYISSLADNIIYSFSATDGLYAGCYFDNNITEITYKDINNDILNLDDGKSLKDIVETNANIDYAVIRDNYAVVDKNDYEALTEKTDEKINEIANNKSNDSSNWVTVKKQSKNYAYIDNNGNLFSNIDIVNKAKEQIGQNIKYVKIVGDGDTFYILTEEGEVYFITSVDNGNYAYMLERLGINSDTRTILMYYTNREDFIYKLNVNNVIDIYDTLTAKTKDGNIISLINETKQDTSAVQELQKQTDKYLLASHLGLKDGKLYNFDNVNQGVEVTKGEIYKVENKDDSIGIYSGDTKVIKLYARDVDAYPIEENLGENEIYINVQKIEGNLPEFIDIVEYRDTYFARPSYTVQYGTFFEYIDSGNTDKYAKCFAIAKDGSVYAYINGCVVETKMNLDYFGPTANYELSNSNWTNSNINLKLSDNTTNEIKTAVVKKGNNVIEGVNAKQVEIDKNGIYSYTITDKKERTYSEVLTVKNIDKLKPYNPEIQTVGDKIQVTFKDDREATEDFAKSGIKEKLISYDGTNWTKINEDTILLNVDGNVTIFAKAIDNAGNESDIVSGRKDTQTGVVIAKYQDMAGQEIHQDKIYSGSAGESYDVQIIEIDGYDYVESTGSLNGTYLAEEQIVILIYKKIEEPGPDIKKGNVIVIYQDLEGNKLRENKTISGNVGDSYETQRINIEGYEFAEVEGQENGNITIENQFVTYKYKKSDKIEIGKVTVKYLDENGNSIKEDVVLTGNVGEDYKTEKVEFEIYKLV